MTPFRIEAIPTEIAQKVRQTLRAPFHGFPAYSELAADDAPCRHCLRTFQPAVDRRILFTHDRFAGIESFPQPGPVYIHEYHCPRYAPEAGFPEQLRSSPRTLEAYAYGRHLVALDRVGDQDYETAIDRLLARKEVGYILVNSTTAGCYTFRIERS
ncbi:MAG TPA: DUF1203 domain-containing protein [Candidatus Saccharimonadales bacterium]|nr:DUF1203 domain-containing protein [Candidatus Saccharimonadales bacterium]